MNRGLADVADFKIGVQRIADGDRLLAGIERAQIDIQCFTHHDLQHQFARMRPLRARGVVRL